MQRAVAEGRSLHSAQTFAAPSDFVDDLEGASKRPAPPQVVRAPNATLIGKQGSTCQRKDHLSNSCTQSEVFDAVPISLFLSLQVVEHPRVAAHPTHTFALLASFQHPSQEATSLKGWNAAFHPMPQPEKV